MHKSLAICAALCALVLCGSAMASAHAAGDGKPWQVAEGMPGAHLMDDTVEAGQPLKAMPRALLDHTDYSSYHKENKLQSKYYSYAKWAFKVLSRYPDVLKAVLGDYYEECYKLYFRALKKVYSYQEWNAETCQYDTYYHLVISIKYGDGYTWNYYDIDIFIYVPYGYSYPEYAYRFGYQGSNYIDGEWS